MPKKPLIIGLAVVIALATGLYLFMFSNAGLEANQETVQTDPKSSDPTSEISGVEDQTDYIRIAAMGDMLPHDTVNLRAKTSTGYDYAPFFSQVRSYVNGADITFCNQEAPSAGESYGISGYPTFNAPTEFSRDLNSFGCNVINLANNHVADKGQAAVDATLQTWGKLDTLAVAGANSSQAQQDQVSYFTVRGKKFAFIAFTDLSNNKSIAPYSINMFSRQMVTQQAKEASKNSDYVIASAHWGTEDSDQPSQSQIEWATLMADNGVDLIIGTGPHVLQPVDTIGETTVFYSIGNFLSSQLTIEQLTSGIAFIDLPADLNGPPKLSFAPTYMSYTWSASEAAAEDLLARDNLSLIPLSLAEPEIAQSLFSTSAEAQITRITSLLTKNDVAIEILD